MGVEEEEEDRKTAFTDDGGVWKSDQTALWHIPNLPWHTPEVWRWGTDGKSKERRDVKWMDSMYRGIGEAVKSRIKEKVWNGQNLQRSWELFQVYSSAFWQGTPTNLLSGKEYGDGQLLGVKVGNDYDLFLSATNSPRLLL